jgi:dipeptidyl-peptidase-4
MKKILSYLGAAVLILFAVFVSMECAKNAASKTEDLSRLSLERIYQSNEFGAERFGPARWLEDGSGYTILEDSESETGGREILRYDPETGERLILVSSDRLVPSGRSKPLGISDYVWSEDGQKLLIFTNTRRVWRQNTRGDYWVLNLSSGRLQQVDGKADEATLMFAKFSPDATRVAYVKKNNIYVEDLISGRITPLTRDGTETLINGTFDWVYEEEFGLRDGFRWSPDGRHIAFWQLESKDIPLFHMINNTDLLYPRIISFRHPKVGQTNSICRIGVVSAAGGKTRWLDLPGDLRDNYVARMDWAAGSDEIVIQRLNRLQNTNRVMLGNISSGRLTNVFTDEDEAWVEVVDDLKWMEDGKKFTWVSERDGWSHVYLISRDGQDIRNLTPGDYDVISIDLIDEKGGRLYFTASPDNPTQRHLYSVPLDGSGTLTRVTPESQSGSSSYQISHDGRWAFHSWSSFSSPPLRDLIRLPSHEVVRNLVFNRGLRTKVEALQQTPVEFFDIDIGKGIVLNAWCMKPPDFDPGKKYPLLFYIYGEPAGSTVRDSWGGEHLSLAPDADAARVCGDERRSPGDQDATWTRVA